MPKPLQITKYYLEGKMTKSEVIDEMDTYIANCLRKGKLPIEFSDNTLATNLFMLNRSFNKRSTC